MKLSQLIGDRFKEKPADATIISQILMLRGGYIKNVSNGIYSLLPPAKKIVNKIEAIIREEMDKIGGQEVLMPVVMPRELWEESGRYNNIGSELLRFKDRSGRDMLLGMTHEEAAVHIVRDSINSYNKLPVMLYQLQTKFRDEARTKGGLIRVREFTMKDAYSFHTSQADLETYYKQVYDAYFNIFKRIGIPEVIAVGSDTGMMGGSVAHEYMLLSDAGEDRIVVCEDCDYKDNIEVAKSQITYNNFNMDCTKELVSTPNITTIEDLSTLLSTSKDKLIKACVFVVEDSKDEIVVVFIRGDYEVNETKLKKVLKKNIFPLENTDGVDLSFGFIGPVNLNSTSKINVLYDISLKNCCNMVCGANQTDFHFKGICVNKDFNVDTFVDIYEVKNGDICPECGKHLTINKGIEVGNIFQLGTKYSGSMGMSYTDETGKQQVPIMGCYGIGVGRAMASVVEARHDDKGPIWPFAIAPWHVHICMLNGSEEMISTAKDFYSTLLKNNVEVIFDDRGASAGVQFSDADLLGVPYRVIFGNKNFKDGKIEVQSRDKTLNTTFPIEEGLQFILNTIKEEKSKI